MYYTPLRYPGGKAKIAPYIKSIIKNREGKLKYIEPFAGGAACGLSLLFEGFVSEITINDFDLGIYSFWKSVVYDTDRFVIAIENAPLSINEWSKQKKIYEEYIDSNSCFELGFATFYLNRTNRSGILKAGPIGGKQQSGKWKLDARFNKVDLIKRIKKIGQYRHKINVTNIDLIKSFDEFRKLVDENTIIYFDPPYVNKGKDLYMNYLTSEDHIALRNSIQTLKNVNWIITYDNCDLIREAYSEFPIIDIYLTYSLCKKTRATEMMIFSDKSLVQIEEYKSK